MFDDILKNYYLIPIFSMLIVTITFGINNWDMTDIEKKLITRFKRLQIESSLILIETIIIGISFSIILNKKMFESFEEVDDIYLKTFLICITMFCVVIPFTLSIHLIVLFTKWLLVPKINYYVILNDSNEKWFLKRTAIKGQILLKNKEEDCIFIKDWDNLKFNTCEPIYTKIGNHIYKNKKRYNSVLKWLLLSMFLIIGFYLYPRDRNVEISFLNTSLILALLFLLTIYFVILYAKKYYLITESKDTSK